MTKLFSVASWNVKHFKGQAARRTRVVNFLKEQRPDIFSIYEVTGSEVFKQMTESFPGYTFHITEGPQTQEILLGVASHITAFVTQKVEFKSGVTYMRPGLLATITVQGVNYTILFLHIASGAQPRGMGLRDDMLERAVKFRKVLDKAQGGKNKARYIFLGDLNTMGMEYPYNKNIEPGIELKKWDGRASQYYGMQRLPKTHDHSWRGGKNTTLPKSNLDHVFASRNIKFREFKKADGSPANVSVRGWVDLATETEQVKWVDSYSDHSLLYFEVIE